jgi:hypothetical protein
VAAEVKINWHADKVRLQVDKSVAGSMANVALRIEEHTKINIRETPGASGQGLVDTGFMWNSVYVVVHRGSKGHESDYDKTQASGAYTDRSGKTVERQIAPRRPLSGKASALVAVGADYAIFQEIKHAFFFKAIEETGKEVGGLIEKF